ncbi:MAG: membrane dipeptidase [Acidobacteriota bacterium]|nr:membrane dipeptidase [Acidobacteriota bacterium]
MPDASKLPRLTEELLCRGHSEREVRGVLGENFLGFWERARQAAASMGPAERPRRGGRNSASRCDRASRRRRVEGRDPRRDPREQARRAEGSARGEDRVSFAQT